MRIKEWIGRNVDIVAVIVTLALIALSFLFSGCATGAVIRAMTGDIASQAAFEEQAEATADRFAATEKRMDAIDRRVDSVGDRIDTVVTALNDQKLLGQETLKEIKASREADEKARADGQSARSEGAKAGERSAEAVGSSRLDNQPTDWATIIGGITGAILTIYGGMKVGQVVEGRKNRQQVQTIVDDPNIDTNSGLKATFLAKKKA